MSWLPPVLPAFAPIAATVLVATALGFGAGWTVHGWRMAAQKSTQVKQEAAKKAADQQQADKASAGFEDARTKNEVRYETVVKVVEKIVDRPVYRSVCLDDDGVQLLNRQIERVADTAEPEPRLPESAKDSR